MSHEFWSPLSTHSGWLSRSWHTLLARVRFPFFSPHVGAVGSEEDAAGKVAVFLTLKTGNNEPFVVPLGKMDEGEILANIVGALFDKCDK